MSTTDIAIRLAVAFVVGAALGLEREKRGRAAGLRTTLLVCVAACIAMILSEMLPAAGGMPAGTFGGDPARLAAGVLTGMGFLGAGVILRQDTLIRGVTTAAVLWLACILGLAAGSGHFGLCAGGFGIALVALLVLPHFERLMDNDGYITIEIGIDGDDADMPAIVAVLRSNRVRPLTTGVGREAGAVTVSVHATAPSRDSLELPDQVTRALRALPGVRSARWTA